MCTATFFFFFFGFGFHMSYFNAFSGPVDEVGLEHWRLTFEDGFYILCERINGNRILQY